MNGEDWYDMRHGRLIITPDGTTKERVQIKCIITVVIYRCLIFYCRLRIVELCSDGCKSVGLVVIVMLEPVTEPEVPFPCHIWCVND